VIALPRRWLSFRRPLTPAIALLFLLAGVPALAIEKEAPAEQLRQLDEQKRKAEQVLREVESKQSAVFLVLERIEHERREAEAEAKVAHKKEEAAAAKLSAARKVEEGIRDRRIALAHDLGPRLLLRYRLRGASYLQMILSAPSIGDVLWRRRMVDTILKDDFALIRRWADTQREEGKAVAAVEAQQQDFSAAEEAARERADDAAARKNVQDGVLHGLGRQRATWERLLAEVEHSRGSMLQLISTLPPTPAGLGGFGKVRGQLDWPVPGTVEVKYGRQVDPRFKTVLQQKGFDIRAPEGAVVRAPYAASVGYAGWFSGFGNLVILDHGEGYYTLYAHLRETSVAKGDRVAEGTELGSVGDTGSLKGAYLYFEIRSGSKALDPAQWLRKK
jgi:septal ring factor EnvC (AmiA/AmiB activator)